jgi:serine/threonine protein phosphatase PrpC
MPLKYGGARHDGYLSPTEDIMIHKICKNGYEIFGIFDGHGGDFYSRNVSDLLLYGLEDFFDIEYSLEEIKQILHNLFERTDNILYDCYPTIGGGSTAIVAVITPTDVILANTGDSAAMLLSKSSDILTHFTHDHTPDDEGERLRVLAAGGTVTQGIQDVKRINSHLALTRAFGDWQHKKKGLIVTPTIYIWPRTNAILALYSDSFTEDHAEGSANPRIILNCLTKTDVYKNLKKFITYDTLGQAAAAAVNEQVNKFKVPLLQIYNGDNTSLIFIDIEIISKIEE